MSVELSNSEEKPHCSYSNDAKSSFEKEDISQPKKGRRGIKRLSRPRRTSTCSSVSEPTETIDINGFDSDSDEDSTSDFEGKVGTSNQTKQKFPIVNSIFRNLTLRIFKCGILSGLFGYPTTPPPPK